MRPQVAYLQEECVLHFLMGLNDSFSQVRAQVLTMEPFPNITMVFALAIQEERQQSLSPNPVQIVPEMLISSNELSINAVQTSSAPRSSCYRYFCTHCKVKGHSKERCFKLNGYLTVAKPQPQGQQSYRSFNSGQINQVLVTFHMKNFWQ